MSRTRRTFGKDFKAKVVLEALKEKDNRGVLKSTSCCPIKFQCGSPKRYGIFLQFFCGKNGRCQDEIPTEKLYARIGQLTLENDFLKKS
jgi:hypothetical protein